MPLALVQMPVQRITPFSLVPALIALQFVVFGWRIAREVSLGDQQRRTWLLLSDVFNLASMVAVVGCCVVLPLRTAEFGLASRIVLGVGYVLVAFTPLIIAGHYRLFSRDGRTIYIAAGRDYPWLTLQEAVLAGIAITCSVAAAWFIAAY